MINDLNYDKYNLVVQNGGVYLYGIEDGPPSQT